MYLVRHAKQCLDQEKLVGKVLRAKDHFNKYLHLRYWYLTKYHSYGIRADSMHRKLTGITRQSQSATCPKFLMQL